MHRLLKIGVAFLVFGYFAACSPVKFDRAPEPACGSDGVACVQKCSGDACFQTYSIDRTVGEGMVDILIVTDNSGSMSFEQAKMRDRFPDFLQSLASLDYRVGMVTTDISSRFTATPLGIRNNPGPYNGNGALQDGKLIDFGGGLKFIDRNTPNRDSLFYQQIVRQETIRCEQSGYRECPSDDERGIFAANLALDSQDGFHRSLGHLAVIVLADEESRGISEAAAQSADDRQLARLYPQEANDKPQTFVQKFRQKFPGKGLSVHSIIVKPGDTGCIQAQSAQGTWVRGTQGFAYAELSALTGGKIGSICEPDYGAQLRDIGSYLQGQVVNLPFACRPVNDDFKVTIDPKPAQDVDVVADFDKMQLDIKTPLAPLTKVRLEYTCAKPN